MASSERSPGSSSSNELSISTSVQTSPSSRQDQTPRKTRRTLPSDSPEVVRAKALSREKNNQQKQASRRKARERVMEEAIARERFLRAQKSAAARELARHTPATALNLPARRPAPVASTLTRTFHEALAPSTSTRTPSQSTAAEHRFAPIVQSSRDARSTHCILPPLDSLRSRPNPTVFSSRHPRRDFENISIAPLINPPPEPLRRLPPMALSPGSAVAGSISPPLYTLGGRTSSVGVEAPSSSTDEPLSTFWDPRTRRYELPLPSTYDRRPRSAQGDSDVWPPMPDKLACLEPPFEPGRLVYRLTVRSETPPRPTPDALPGYRRH